MLALIFLCNLHAITPLNVLLSSPPLDCTQVDHPFLFAVRDLKSGLLLFIGNMESPEFGI